MLRSWTQSRTRQESFIAKRCAKSSFHKKQGYQLGCVQFPPSGISEAMACEWLLGLMQRRGCLLLPSGGWPQNILLKSECFFGSFLLHSSFIELPLCLSGECPTIARHCAGDIFFGDLFGKGAATLHSLGGHQHTICI